MQRLVTASNLVVHHRGESVLVENEVIDSGLEAPAAILAVLEYFREARSVEEFLASQPGVERDVIDQMAAAFILLEEDEAPFLRSGFLRRTRSPIGADLAYSDLAEASHVGASVVLGAPSDVGSAGGGGARHGPGIVRLNSARFLLPATDPELREQGHAFLDPEMRRRYRLSDVRVFDMGDVGVLAGEPLEVIGGRIRKAVRGIMAAQAVPILIGGDNSVTWFALQAALERFPGLGILHFDAHHNAFHSATGTIGDYNVMAFARGRPEVASILQLGVRSLEVVLAARKPVHDPRMRFLSARELRALRPVEVLGSLPKDRPYYLSFDMDCLVPELAPEVETIAPGGIDYYQGLELIDHAVRNLRIVGADFVGVAGRDHRVNGAARTAARYVNQVILSRCPHVPLEDYVHESHSPVHVGPDLS